MAMEAVSEAKAGQYLTFHLNGQAYAVPINTIREINRVSEITPVPQTPMFVAGVMNLRGKVIPVVNLRMRLGLPKIAYTRETCIIVIEGDAGQVGMIVDSVNSVIDLAVQQIEPPTVGGAGENSFVMGMGKLESQVIVLLAIVRCLSKDALDGKFVEQSSETQSIKAA